MKTIVRARKLNDAFKRFQRLPELPVTESCGHRGGHSFAAIGTLALHSEPARELKEARFAEVLTG